MNTDSGDAWHRLRQDFGVVLATGNEIVVTFQTDVYRLSAVKKAAYKFGDRFYVRIVTGDAETRVQLKPKKPIDCPAEVVGEFGNEVLDQELREQVAEETEAIRNLLLAQVYSDVSLVDPEGDESDYHDDPLRIRVSQAESVEITRDILPE